MQVNVFEAKASLSHLLRLLESKKEDSITIARNGKPIAKMTVIQDTPVSNRIGFGKGKFNYSGDFDACNSEISEMLSGGNL